MTKQTKTVRARDLGIDLDGTPGPQNAITDIEGVAVGMTTIIEQEPRTGRNKLVRTGVTAIVPHCQAATPHPVWAGISRFNGNGEMTGSHWIEDGGYFVGPVLLTNTHNVGIAHHAAVKWMIAKSPYADEEEHLWVMPVVAETYDGVLNDINAQALTENNVLSALDTAKPGPVAEGNTGGGTGMITYEFKGGTGTASRTIQIDGKAQTVGVLVQSNFGRREWLTIAGAPVGRHFPKDRIEIPPERGSIIAVIATDIPMMPHQLKRLARRAALGIGRTGTIGGNSSGDIFLAFSTANAGPLPHEAEVYLQPKMLNDENFDPVYEAAVQSVEEAVLNALVAAESMGGTQWDEVLVPAIDHSTLVDVLRKYNRLKAIG
jgi:D-aminopeptidase